MVVYAFCAAFLLSLASFTAGAAPSAAARSADAFLGFLERQHLLSASVAVSQDGSKRDGLAFHKGARRS